MLHDTVQGLIKASSKASVQSSIRGLLEIGDVVRFFPASPEFMLFLADPSEGKILTCRGNSAKSHLIKACAL